MARPSVTHDGFLVPNAATVSHPRMAEPDQVDFNITAHALWGVIEGCLVTVTGSTASTLGGTVLVNGTIIRLATSTAQIGVGSAQDRFDLLVADIGGTLTVIPGLPAVDPVFPDPYINCTVLAAVFCPAGLTSFVDNVIDKRKFVSRALLTKIAAAAPLIQNLNGSGNHYQVSGNGQTSWEDDTFLYRSAIEELRVHSKLIVDTSIATGSLTLSPGGVTAAGAITGSNLMTGSTLPGAAANGTIFQATDGRIYVRKNNAWSELATVTATNPVGTIITSLQPPSVMTPLGWVPLDGRTISESDYGSLFTIPSLAPYITGVSPNRSMVLPNANNRVLMSAVTPAVLGGPSQNQVTLSLSQMPRHKHNVRSQLGGSSSSISARTGRDGTHTHAVSGGLHSHGVDDHGHAHNGADFFGNASPMIALMWGGGNKIDALFNDRNHTYSVEAMDWTKPAYSNITIDSAGSAHGHIISQDGDHDHVVTFDPIAAHEHVISEDDTGGSAPLDITPSYLTVITYIRS